MEKKFLEDSYTIKDLPETERPREKLLKYGCEYLSNEELLAVIIRTGNKTDTAIEIGKKILALDSRGLGFLTDVTAQELKAIKGVGDTKASQILAAIEIGRRLQYSTGLDKIKVTSPRSIASAFMMEMKFLHKEHFRIILLDTKNQIISVEQVSIGTLNASIVHPRDVFKLAIKKNANALILLHNHPSGDVSPSREDINVTIRLEEVGRLVGIKILDHIIIGNNKYLSFKEEHII